MLVCPRCRRHFHGLRYCPEHGVALLEVSLRAATPLPSPLLGALPPERTVRPMADTPDGRVGTVIADSYLIRERLGQGGMGTVYQAEHLTLGRPVALKILRRELSDREQSVLRFEREARLASQLHHPSCVMVLDFGQAGDGCLYLAMELLVGIDLFDLLSAHRWLDVPRALRIALQLCAGLAEAHQLGLVHRDIKPENIFLVEDPGFLDRVKILDFGLAKSLLPGPGEVALSSPGTCFGTPEYLAPEAARGDPVDHRADLYALGVLLYRMVSGRLPFGGTNKAALLLQQATAPPPRFATLDLPQPIPPRLEELIFRLLAKDPATRPPDALTTGTLLSQLA
ncbi:MAG: serine/threonine-protein kinase [Myxococcota bacterium]|nr:serine/threonine-protein kinase [Myxococcota bacterium]